MLLISKLLTHVSIGLKALFVPKIGSFQPRKNWSRGLTTIVSLKNAVGVVGWIASLHFWNRPKAIVRKKLFTGQ